MKPVILGGCQKCKGPLAQEQDGLIYDEERKVWEVEYACTYCGNRVYLPVKDPNDVRTRSYN